MKKIIRAMLLSLALSMALMPNLSFFWKEDGATNYGWEKNEKSLWNRELTDIDRSKEEPYTGDSYDPEFQEIEISREELPKTMELFMPKQTEILGIYEMNTEYTEDDIQLYSVYLSSDYSYKKLYEYYCEELPRRGWENPDGSDYDELDENYYLMLAEKNGVIMSVFIGPFEDVFDGANCIIYFAEYPEVF